MAIPDSDPPALHWKGGRPELKITGDWEQALRGYFAQEKELFRVELELLTPGRAGASVARAHPTARRGNRETRLQPELVKFGNLERSNLVEEVERFKLLAEHTELVHGQGIARPLFVGAGGTLGVFSYRLLESGTDLSPFYAVALTRPDDARTALSGLLDRLVKWYGRGQSAQSGIPWNVPADRIEQSLKHLAAIDPVLTADLNGLLKPEKWRDVPGTVTRVHNDLHTENILVPRSGNLAYLIDFGSASADGSACMDVARLESDLIYRLLPLDLPPAALAQFERSLGKGDLAALTDTVAGWLVSRLRSAVDGLLTTPNGAAWFLLGRVLNGLRMLSGTWPEVIPYGYETRRMGIVASLKELGRRLGRALSGSALSPLQGVASRKVPAGVPELDRSLRYLFTERKYTDLYHFARAAAGATPRPPATVVLLGLLGGLSANLSAERLEDLEERQPARADTSRARVIKHLYQGIKALRQMRETRLAIRHFEAARKGFHDLKDCSFEGICADLLARAQQQIGEVESAKILFQDAIALKENVGDRTGLATSHGGLALLYLSTAEYDDAIHHLKEDLRLAVEQADLPSQVKILNWLGQAILEKNPGAATAALDYFSDSLRLISQIQTERYRPELDTAFVHLGKGFCFTRAQAVPHAEMAEATARALFERVTAVAADMAVLQCELLAGEIALLKGMQRTGLFRITAVLEQMFRAGDLLNYLDFGLRESRFLKQLGLHAPCRSIVNQVRGQVSAAIKYSPRLHKELLRLGQ